MESKSSSQFYQPFLFSLVLILGMFLGFKIASKYYASHKNIFKSARHSEVGLDYIISLIEDKYVDSIDRKKLYENGIEGIIASLDPHTVYIPPQETGRVNEELEGNIFGVGIEFFIYKDSIHVLSVLDNSPAKKSTIRPGDIILKIGDSLVAGTHTEDEGVIKLIRGKAKSEVSLLLLKPDKTTSNITLKRETIVHNSITAAYTLPGHKDIGYIAIRLFSENTYREFAEALKSLNNQGIKKLIIDVRDNPGGYMDAVTSILDEIIAGKHTLLTTKSKSGNETVTSEVTGMFEQGKLCVLINESSASASEILAGAVQDLDRGTLIGRRSYGKGLVQEQFSLPNDGALRITVSRYYLPSGRCIQKDYSKGKNEYMSEVYERYLPHGKKKDSAAESTRKKFYTTSKRVVYGDEGVMPDVEIKLDTTYSDQMDSVYNFNLIEIFAAQYYYYHQAEFTKIKDAASFATYTVSEQANKELYNYLHSEIKTFSTFEYEKQKRRIFNLLIAEFAHLHLDNNAKYMRMSLDDKMIQAAVDN